MSASATAFRESKKCFFIQSMPPGDLIQEQMNFPQHACRTQRGKPVFQIGRQILRLEWLRGAVMRLQPVQEIAQANFIQRIRMEANIRYDIRKQRWSLSHGLLIPGALGEHPGKEEQG